eukprot:GHRR01037006.1.p2 GENE.GHRR01037006.1~~GHRR01037006.1.p2  ORF type:complete len:153 (+),score=37.45 GHRR01037006.1:979-1437(+)
MSIISLMKDTGTLLRTLVWLMTWFSLYITGYGIVLGSGALPGSLYMTFTFMAAAELVAMLSGALLIDQAGRHNVITLGLVLGGSGCLGCAVARGQITQSILAVMGKFGCSSEYAGTDHWFQYGKHAQATTSMQALKQAARCRCSVVNMFSVC